MQIIAGPQGSGKTTEAIRIANENDAHLVVANSKTAQFLQTKCANKVLTYAGAFDPTCRRWGQKALVIDDIAQCLEYLSSVTRGAQLIAGTVNTKEAVLLANGFLGDSIYDDLELSEEHEWF